jgi:hypothetical protein
MEILISVAGTNLINSFQKGSQFSVVSRALSFLEVKNSVSLLLVLSSVNLRF